MPYAAGQKLTAGLLNGVTFSGYQSAGAVQTHTTSVWTVINFDLEATDSHGGHSTVTLNSQYTVQVAGDYTITAGVAFAANATGVRGAKIFLNGAAIPRGETLIQAAATVGTTPMITIVHPCIVGDIITVLGFQASGGNLATLSNGEAASHLEIALDRR